MLLLELLENNFKCICIGPISNENVSEDFIDRRLKDGYSIQDYVSPRKRQLEYSNSFPLRFINHLNP